MMMKFKMRIWILSGDLSGVLTVEAEEVLLPAVHLVGVMKVMILGVKEESRKVMRILCRGKMAQKMDIKRKFTQTMIRRQQRMEIFLLHLQLVLLMMDLNNFLRTIQPYRGVVQLKNLFASTGLKKGHMEWCTEPKRNEQEKL